MPFVHRDQDKKITAISSHQNDYCNEEVSEKSPEFVSALLALGGSSIESDLSMVRAVEDLIDLLVEKSVINVNELPQAVQMKILARKSLRVQGAFSQSDELIKI